MHHREYLADGATTLTSALLVLEPDIADDTSTTATLTVGAPATVSTLGTIGDQDFFKVQLVAGKTYEIGMFAKAGGPDRRAAGRQLSRTL